MPRPPSRRNRSSIEKFPASARRPEVGRKGVYDGLIFSSSTSTDRLLRIELGYALEGVIPTRWPRRVDIDGAFTPLFLRRTAISTAALRDGRWDRSVQKLAEGEKLPPSPQAQIPRRPRRHVAGRTLQYAVPLSILLPFVGRIPQGDASFRRFPRASLATARVPWG